MSMLPAMIAANASAARAAARDRVLQPFKQAGATGPERAIAYGPVEADRASFAELRRTGVLVEAGGGRFWHDEQAGQVAGRRGAKQALAIMGATLAVAAAALALTR